MEILPLDPKFIPCAIYTRVSTDEQAKEEHYSLSAQEEYCRSEIDKHKNEGWFVKEVISDPGYSGFSFERPGLLRLIGLAKEGKIKVVVVYKRERLFRNADLAAQVHAVFDLNSVKVVSYVEGTHDASPHSVLMRQFIDANAQFERANGRMRVRDCMRFAAKKGDWKGGTPPFGYSYTPGSKILTIYEEEAKIVRVVFEKIAAGALLKDVVNELRIAGVRARSSRKVKILNDIPRAIFFTGDSIRHIIECPSYRGIVRVKKNDHDSIQQKTKAVEWEEFPGRHVPIVAEDLWFKANRCLKAQPISKNKGRNLRINSRSGILQGLVRCIHCNSSMTPVVSGIKKPGDNGHRYYRCSYFVKGHAETNCLTRQISAPAIETALITVIQNIEANPATFTRIGFNAGGRRTDEVVAGLQRELDSIDKEIADKKTCIQNLLTIVGQSGASALHADAYEEATRNKETVAKLEYKRIECEANLNKLAARIPPLTEISKSFGAIARALSISDDKGKSTLYRSIVRKVAVERIFLDSEDCGGFRASSRTYRMVVEFNTNAVILFGVVNPDPVALLTKFADLQLRTTFEIRSNAKNQKITMLEFGCSVVSQNYQSEKESCPPVFAPQNPVQRALRWKFLIDEGKTTATQIADEEKISKGMVSQIMALLKLPQTIVDFMKDGKDARLPKRFSLRELQRLCEMRPNDALSYFYSRTNGQSIQQIIELK